MDKRAIIGIAMSILVLVIYQELVSRFYPRHASTAPVPAIESKSDAKNSKPASRQRGQRLAAGSRVASCAPPATISSRQAAREVKIETENYIAVFTTQGARLKSFKFKKYRSLGRRNSPPLKWFKRRRACRCPWASVGRRRSRSTTAAWFIRCKAAISVDRRR